VKGACTSRVRTVFICVARTYYVTTGLQLSFTTGRSGRTTSQILARLPYVAAGAWTVLTHGVARGTRTTTQGVRLSHGLSGDADDIRPEWISGAEPRRRTGAPGKWTSNPGPPGPSHVRHLCDTKRPALNKMGNHHFMVNTSADSTWSSTSGHSAVTADSVSRLRCPDLRNSELCNNSAVLFVCTCFYCKYFVRTLRGLQ